MLIFRSAVIPDMPIKFLNPISISTALDIEHIACTTQHYSKRCNDAAEISIFSFLFLIGCLPSKAVKTILRAL